MTRPHSLSKLSNTHFHFERSGVPLRISSLHTPSCADVISCHCLNGWPVPQPERSVRTPGLFSSGAVAAISVSSQLMCFVIVVKANDEKWLVALHHIIVLFILPWRETERLQPSLDSEIQCFCKRGWGALHVFVFPQFFLPRCDQALT